MGNIGSQTGQISGSRADFIPNPTSDVEPWVRSHGNLPAPIKVLPDPESRQRLRHTDNGEILQSGGTLSGRHQIPLRHGNSKNYTPAQRYSFHKTGLKANPSQKGQNFSSQRQSNGQIKTYKSEPDLRFPPVQEMKEKRSKKKYKAPPPPTNEPTQVIRPAEWDENLSDEFPSRRTRLFKTRVETKKESSQAHNRYDQAAENISDVVEEKIQAKECFNGYSRTNRMSLSEFHLNDTEFQRELREATDRLRITKVEESKPTEEQIQIETPHEEPLMQAEGSPRGEPSGKESSTPDNSPVLGPSDNQKPRTFYFGMEREESDASSNCPSEEEEENPAIALRLRPVLPRKPPEIPRFSPAAAWRLLDSRSHDSGISADARPPLTSSWTPQQDLGDDSSVDEAAGVEIREVPRSTSRHRAHVFSLSLPRDHQLASFAAMTMNSSRNSGVSSLRRLKRSVSGVLSNLSTTKKDQDKRSFRQDDSNWFFSRSAPNSLNDNSPEVPEVPFNHVSSTSRLMYLPETNNDSFSTPPKYPISNFSKSCEELRVPESLRDPQSPFDVLSLNRDNRPKKSKKFTFQSTVRQIERRRMAERLSKEAEKKEKQRLREVEAMRRVEEEFQKKRAKEKADIRNQLRLYAMDDNKWSSLPPNINVKTEERQEPEGAISSSTSSYSPPPKPSEQYKKKYSPEGKISTQATEELSEYRQATRDYKEYRSNIKYSGEKCFKQTTVHPKVTYNMPRAKGSNALNGNYRKDFACGVKSTKSIGSNQSEGSLSNSPRGYRDKFSPTTRF